MANQILVGVPITNATTATIDYMVGEVADLVGGIDDPIVKAKALKFLDRAADRLNMAGVFLYRRKENDYTIVSGDSGATTLSTPNDWGWPEKKAYSIDSDGDVVNEIQWVPWDVYRDIATADTTGAEASPEYLSIRNENDATIYCWPPIDPDDVTTIRVTYFARVLRPSEVSDSSLLASKETIEAIISGGEAMMMRFRHKNQPSLWMPFMDEFERLSDKAKAVAHRNQQVIDSWAHVGEIGYEQLSTGTYLSPGSIVLKG